jgi:predicted XRE-type DNA-binding protein
MNTAEEDTRVFVGSDNVFADLGLPDAEEHLTKAALVSRIGEIIKNRHLTQQKAAEILGIDQPKISKLMRGHFQDFSTDRLFRLLNSLDRDIEIIIRKKPSSRTKAQVRVVAA